MAKIHAACFPKRPWRADELADLCAQTGAHLITHESGQGFALARNIAREAELLTIAVCPSAQGSGIGAALLGDLDRSLIAAQCEQLFLEVAADNAPALALYTKSGFSRIGLRKSYYSRSKGPDIDAVLMAKTLRTASG